MTPERWEQVRSLFDRAVEQPPDRRLSWLQSQVPQDPELFADVASLLEAFHEEDGPLDRGAAGALLAHAVRTTGDPYEGTRVGPYEILRRVGRGGMGSVYSAMRADGEYRKMVAIKLVNPGVDSADILRRFRTERQVLASLDHPNIARLLDGGTTESGLPYLVMEYVDGQPIDQYCDAHSLSISERLRLFSTVCDAVHFAHQNLVIHRDIKPGNILMTAEGTPKLLDFGIAKLLRPEFSEAAAGLTRAGLRPLTPDYASPEQVRNGPMTTASDVYSLGVLLYQLLTGHLPYRTGDHSAAEIERIICDTEPSPPSLMVSREEVLADSRVTPAAVAGVREGDLPRLQRRLRGDLDVILLMALRKEPQRRYPSAERLADDIRRHLTGQPVFAQKDTLAYRVRKFVQRNRAAVVTAVVVLVSLVAALTVSQHYRRQAQQRFRAALDLSSYVLNDLDKAMQNSVTDARQRLLAKELDYLNRLRDTAQGDPDLQKHLLDGYVSMGDVQGNLYAAHTGEAGEALKSYRKALDLAEIRAAAAPAGVSAQLDLAEVLFRIATVTRYQQDSQPALDAYRRIEVILTPIAQATPTPEALSLLARTSMQNGTLLSQLGQAKESLEEAEQSLGWARAWLSRNPQSADARKAVTLATEWSGRFLADVGRPAEGVERVREAVSQYEEFLRSNPASAKARRDLLAGYLNLGDVEELLGRPQDSARTFALSLETAEAILAQDPRNQQAQRDVYTAAARSIPPLLKLKRDEDARRATVRSLAILRPLVQVPEPTLPDLYQYAFLLATTPFADLRNPQAGLAAAQRAVESTQQKDPWMLDLLARARFAVGDAAGAVEAERQALALLPREPASAMRTEFEANLSRWLAPAPREK